MRIALVANPVSGQGRALAAAQELACALRQAGHEARLIESSICGLDSWLVPALDGVALLVVVGGDGAVRMVLEAAARRGVPLYHAPCGTENLFAREFGMDRRAQTLLAAIDRWQVETVDLATANHEMFALMASVGFDAEVVHELSQTRGASISHWSYLRPFLRQLSRWRPPRLAVTVDGRRIDDGRRGFVVVANSGQYAARLDPCRGASMTDGELDVVWFACRSKLGLLVWMLRCWAGWVRPGRGLVRARGRAVLISCEVVQRYQLDGDPALGAGVGPEAEHCIGTGGLRIAVQPGALRVLHANGKLDPVRDR